MFAGILAIASLAGGIMQFMAAQDAARDQEKLARMNAQATEAESREQARRESAANRREEALSRARAAASGLATTGSISQFLNAQEAENRRGERWIMEAGSRRAGIERYEGKARAKVTRTQGWSSLLSSGGDVYTYGKGAGWF